MIVYMWYLCVKFNKCDIIHMYIKPHTRPEPAQVLNLSSTTSTPTQAIHLHSIAAADKKDITWQVVRRGKDTKQEVPAWTAYNSYLSTQDLPVTTVRYLPFIRASPTELSTIYTSLLNLVAVSHKLDQSHILVTADMAIYSKAQEILWSKPTTLEGKITMRIGGMHLLMAFLASIGKLYGDGGLLMLLTESGMYAEGTARQMLLGK